MIRRLGSKSQGMDDDSEKSKLKDELQQCATLSAAAKMIESNLVIKMAKGMMCNPEDINTQKPLHSFGVDSLVAVEVRNWLFKELKSGKCFLPVTLDPGRQFANVVTQKLLCSISWTLSRFLLFASRLLRRASSSRQK